MSSAVQEIVQRIKALSDKDREALDQILAEMVEREWQKEARRARRGAKKMGITQETIDRAVAKVRYGK